MIGVIDYLVNTVNIDDMNHQKIVDNMKDSLITARRRDLKISQNIWKEEEGKRKEEGREKKEGGREKNKKKNNKKGWKFKQ